MTTFRIPVFNLRCNIWRNANATTNPPDVIAACNLTFGRITSPSAGIAQGPSAPSNYMFLQLPKLTDIRDLQCPASFDTVEVPAGSGRYYHVTEVDDIGKGFANEHRCAFIVKFSPWPEPIP